MSNDKKPAGSAAKIAKIRIINNTDAGIELPALPATETSKAFPMLALVPGGNNVPAEYVEAVKAYTVKNKFGQPFRPHENLFEAHMAANRLRFDLDPGATKLPEGPEPPEDLIKVAEVIALDLIATEFNVERLQRWEKKERRDAVKAALFARIAKLS